MDEELDFTKLKYVLYARKSTDDPERQAKSIPDQIYECRLLQTRLGLNVAKVLTEKKSAKIPNIRPVFRDMLRDIKKGVYDGILSWNPDRLARNMMEGGEVINMVDEGQIKDLKFSTHHFTKDANGKMLLGMAFVLSKQYSDKLSQDVTRAVRSRFKEGKSPIPKHGYFRDEHGLYRPDPRMVVLIEHAWILRADGTALEEIVQFLDKSDYHRKTKKGRKIKMTKQMLSDMFKDPFFYGILVQNGQSIDLRDIYDFEPAITEDIYNKVQQLSYRRIKPNKGQSSAYYPLKTLVTCSYCGNNMYIGPTTGHTKRYLMARCGTSECSFKDKSVRLKVVFDFVYDFAKDGLNLTEKDYNRYYDELSKVSDTKKQKLIVSLHSKEGSLKYVNGELRKLALGIIKLEKNTEAWKINENEINKLSATKESLLEEIKDLKKLTDKPLEDKLSLEDFLNLSKNAAKIIQLANAQAKDEICRLIFLNFCVNKEKVLSYQLKEPFATMLKHRDKSSSRGERT